MSKTNNSVVVKDVEKWAFWNTSYKKTSVWGSIWQYPWCYRGFWPKTNTFNLRLSDHIVLARKIVQKAFFYSSHNSRK